MKASIDKFTLQNNEQGFVLVISLMIMTILSLIGIYATNSTVLELQISGNDRIAKLNFFNAESAAYEAIQRLENEADPDNLKASRTSRNWMVTSSGEDDIDWTSDDLATALEQADTTGSTIRMAVVDEGVVAGSQGASLSMTSGSRVYQFKILGHAEKRNAQKTIELGYRKRY